jgi:hypothetical protein
VPSSRVTWQCRNRAEKPGGSSDIESILSKVRKLRCRVENLARQNARQAQIERVLKVNAERCPFICSAGSLTSEASTYESSEATIKGKGSVNLLSRARPRRQRARLFIQKGLKLRWVDFSPTARRQSRREDGGAQGAGVILVSQLKKPTD